MIELNFDEELTGQDKQDILEDESSINDDDIVSELEQKAEESIDNEYYNGFNKPESLDGIYYDMSNEDYHNLKCADIGSISSTNFNDLDLSVAIFENRELFKYDCEAFAVGSLNHTALLEPHLIDEYLETSTNFFNTLKTKRLQEQYKDKTIVPSGSIEIAKERAKKTNLIYGRFVASSKKEVSIIVYDENLGMYRKARTDMWLQDQGIILDYKTSKETKPKDFNNAIEKFNYHLSAAWYIDTVNMAIEKFNLPFPKVNQFGWIISPNYAPYKPYGMICSDELCEKGREKYNNLLDKLLSVRAGGKDLLFHTAFSWEYRKENFI